MPTTLCEKRTVQPAQRAGRYIDQLVDSGAYASASEVVRAGLRARWKNEMPPWSAGCVKMLWPPTCA